MIIFLFAGERVPTCIMRIVWIFQPTSIEIAVASQILLQAGVVLLYLGNVIYVGAVIRAGTGRHTWLTILQVVLSTATLTAFVMGIASIAVEIYTLDERSRYNCLQLQRAVNIYFVALAATPLGLLVAAYFGHRKRLFRVMKDTWFDAAIVGATSLLCMLMSGFKAGVLWAPQRPLWSPAWYHSKSALYVLEFAPEVLLLGLYIMVRIEKRFNALSTPEVPVLSPGRPVMAAPSLGGLTTPAGSKQASMFRERHVSATPPLIPEICYSSPI